MEYKKLKIKKSNSRGTKQDRGKTATTRDLNKILLYLSEVNCENITELSQNIPLNNQKLRDGINFLLAYKIIFISKISTAKWGRYPNVNYYKLNPIFAR